ncbi:hypothetical protein SDC9_98369 [bioreactor metagenome]|uniref:MurNAc-LAA domain-containing protein n=1 Tax=bioreactor metagenome TaxID=1076179 RepID=A0A645AEK8_9ZZZZ|nr:N-acetylmuramoyl-L-alanine amidase [Oscillospiraceae bacterium]
MKIYIDQGHNPNNTDAGAEGHGYREHELTYEIGLLIAAILNDNGFETRLSRNSPDIQLGYSRSSSSSVRIDDARRWGADYIISLHTNASTDPYATGSDCIVSSPDAKPLAETILEQLYITTKLQNRGVYINPGFHSSVRNAIPVILIEMGFITNKGDADLMFDHPDQFAFGISNGIIFYFHLATMSEAYDPAPTPFYQLYPDNNKGVCRLFIEVYSQDKRHNPVSKADVIVYRGMCGNHIVIYHGQTDLSGRTIPVELPLYDAIDSDTVDKSSGNRIMYCICVRHPEYLPNNHWINIDSRKIMYETIELVERHK